MTSARYEVFALPVAPERWMLYAPLTGSLSLTNAEAAREVVAYSENPEPAFRTETVVSLIESGFFSCSRSFSQPDPYASYHPTEVTLFPSERCNLNCSYCYASATASGRLLDWEVAQAAIRLVFENARAQQCEASVLFHGGGEPTLGWEVVERALHYACQLGIEKQVAYRLALASNGAFSERRAHAIGQRFHSITLSWDGPLHDQQRPFIDGKGSLSTLARNCRILAAYPIDVHFRATITQANIEMLSELPERALEMAPNLRSLQVEPSWVSGRCTEAEKPLASDFVEGFLVARKRAEALGVELAYSGFQPDQTRSSFCAISRPGFTVLTSGEVSACYEVKDGSDPRSRWTHFGRYDRESAQFIFDKDTIAALRKLDVRAYSFCEDCFCKWHCAGDCPAKMIPTGNVADHRGSERCEINRALTQAFLLNSLQSVEPSTGACYE